MQQIDTLLRQYGRELTLTTEEGTRTVRGFLQFVSSKSWQSMAPNTSPLGEVSQGQYLYIGPADGGVEAGNRLTADGRSYQLYRVETYHYGGKPLYQWGLCVERREDATWGTTG